MLLRMKKIFGTVVWRRWVTPKNSSRLSENSLKIPNNCGEDSELPEGEGQ